MGILHRTLHGILHRNFKAATFDNIFFLAFWGLLLKKKKKRKSASGEPYDFRFHFFQNSYLLSHETIFFLYKFAQQSVSVWIMLSIFINLRKVLVAQFLLSRIQRQKFLVAIRQTINVLPGNLPRVNECHTSNAISQQCD